MSSLSERIKDARVNLLTNRRFHRLAMRFWPTRLIARQQARSLFDICGGFVYSQVLGACIQLDVFNTLRHGPQCVGDVAAKTKLTPAAARRLLRAAAALELVEHRGDDRYGLGTLGAALLANPGLAQLAAHHAILYRDLADPVALLRGEIDATRMSAFWPYAETSSPDSVSADATSHYTELMAASQPMISEQVLAAYSFTHHRCLLDVGGGSGRFLQAVGSQFPQLTLKLFDLPSVVSHVDPGANRHMEVTGGDFFNDPLPSGADIISVVRILHDHDDRPVESLLKRIYAALPADGTLLIAETLSETRGAERIGDAYFGFYFMAMGKGEPRSRAKLTAMLQAAGFSDVRLHATPVPLVCSVLSAKKGG